MRMLDLKKKSFILLQLIISYHYNTHNTHHLYIEYDTYFLCYTLYQPETLICIVYLLHTYSNNVSKTIFALIQWRRNNAWITLDVILWRMNHCLTFLPNFEEETLEEVLRGVQYGSVSALQINISPAESVSALDTDTGNIMLAASHM